VTLHDLRGLTAYWRRSPPVHLSVAAYLGIGGASGSGGVQPPPADPDTTKAELASVAGPPRVKFVPPARMQ
jgi:hypothetical protein